MIYKLNMIFQDHLFFQPAVQVSHMAYGVPWGSSLPTHPLHMVLASIGPTCGMVSKLYKFISGPLKFLPVQDKLSTALFDVTDKEICWDTVWENLCGPSKNPNHQLKHYKFVHRMYLTPRRHYSMKITTFPNYSLCPLNTLGSFMQVYWECLNVVRFWKEISLTLSDMLEVRTPLVLLSCRGGVACVPP